MTKAELIEAVSNETGVEKATVSRIIESANKKIIQWVGTGKPVYFRGFGSFVPVLAAAKTARNISNNTVINVPSHYKPKFVASNAFKDKVRKLQTY